jgi:hypothetical protein
MESRGTKTEEQVTTMTDKTSEWLNDINSQLREKVLKTQKAGKPVAYIPPNDAIPKYKKGVLIIDRSSDAKGYDAELGTDIDSLDIAMIVWKTNGKAINEYAQIVNNEKDYHKRRDEYWKYHGLLKDGDLTNYNMSRIFFNKCQYALHEHPDDLPIHDKNMALTEKQTAISNILVSGVMGSIKTVCPKISYEDYIALKHEIVKCIDIVASGIDADDALSSIAEKFESIVTGILQNDNFTAHYIKSKTGMKNPVPDIIPVIVWNELEDEEKLEINNAVKSGCHISYCHTGRTQRKEAKEHESKFETETPGDSSADYPLDADVITIKGDKETDKNIILRAICERNIKKIDNPVPDSIPEAVWQQLPDVFKEELCASIDTNKKLQSLFRGINAPVINYIPANTKIPGIFDSLLDTDCIKVHHRRGLFFGSCGIDICFDVKHGLKLSNYSTVSL